MSMVYMMRYLHQLEKYGFAWNPETWHYDERGEFSLRDKRIEGNWKVADYKYDKFDKGEIHTMIPDPVIK